MSTTANEIINDVKRTTSVRTEAKNILETDVKLKVAVIGVGNAGNQAIIKAHKQGMKVYAINTSIKDMSDTILDDTIPCFIVGKESRGAGRDRLKAQELFMENGEDLFSEPRFMTMVQDADVIFLSFATGGGSGSLIGPKLSYILFKMFPKKIIIPYGITPKNSDSIDAKKNSLQCIDEIKLIGCSYMLDDLSFYESLPNDVAFLKIGDHVVESIKVIAGEYLPISSSQMIDENDMKTVCKEGGYMGVYILDNISNADLEKQTMQAMMIDKIKHSPTMAIQKDGLVKQMGVILDCPDDMSDTTKAGNYSELYSFFGGESKGHFENYITTTGTSGQLIIILSGMTLPINRIGQYADAIKQHEENLKRVKDIDLSSTVSHFDFLNSTNRAQLSSDTKASKEEVKSVLGDFFKK